MCLQPVCAQENSPYSRYGIGLLKEQENIANRGMGGTSIADASPLLINNLNPASFASLQLTTYQLAIEGASFTVRNNTASNRTGGAGLSYMNVGVPLKKDKAGLSFGLLPFSRTKYNLQDNDSVPGVSRVLYDYFGGGGLQKAYVGAGYKYQGFSIGATFGYVFGNYQNNVQATFVDSLRILTTDIVNRSIVNGITWEFGAMYELKIKKDNFLNFGVTYSGNSNLDASRDKYWFSSLGGVDQGGYSYAADSIEGEKGTVKLPSTISFGLMYGKGTQWKAGADFIRSDWSQYRYYDQVDSFQQRYTIRTGVSYVPDANDIRSFWKRATYRLGAYYNLEALSLNNTQLDSKAITAGLGMPIGRVAKRGGIGQLNISYQLGQRGELTNNLVREAYSRFAVGITVNDKWFLKRRYN